MTQKGITSTSGAPYSPKIMNQLAESEELKINGKHERAIGIAETILLDSPDCLAAIEELADNFLSLERYEQAEKAADHALKVDTESYIANYTKGFLELSRGNWKTAVHYLQVANTKQPNNPEILRCLGWGLFHLGKRIEGLATLDRARNLRPDDIMILCDLGICCLHCNSFEKAITLFERALELSPMSERAHECLEATKELEKKINNIDADDLSHLI